MHFQYPENGFLSKSMDNFAEAIRQSKLFGNFDLWLNQAFFG